MKLLVKTAGEFELMDTETGFYISNERPHVPPISNFVQSMAGSKLLILANVSDAATDEEFAKYVKDSDGDIKLAIDSFVASFPDGEAAPEPKKKGK